MKKLLLLFAVLVTALTVSAENYILYTSDDGNVLNPTRSDVFGARLVSNTYENGQGKMVFDGDVTEIGARAFDGRTFLTSIEIPASVKSIGYHAFYCCFRLPSIKIPDSVTEIEGGAFERCDLMTSVTLSNSITSINSRTFQGCESLKSIKIPNSVKEIGTSAFDGCSALTNVLLGSSVESIGDYAFSGCNGIKELVSLTTTPPTIQGQGDAFMSRVYNSCKLKVPAAAVSAYKAATYWYWFESVIGLTDEEIAEIEKDFGNSDTPDEPFKPYPITVGVDVSDVGWSSVNFWSWGGDGSHAPANNNWPGDRVTETKVISGHTFYVQHYTINSPTDEVCFVFSTNNGSPQTQDVTGINSNRWFSVSTVMNANGQYHFINDISYLIDDTPETDYLTFEYADSTQTAWMVNGYTEDMPADIVIPAEHQGLPVTSIGVAAFYQCTGLTSVEIPQSVSAIGDWAFAYCSSLRSVNLPEQLTVINPVTFYQCASLTSVEIPQAVTAIGGNAFDGCTSLASVTLGDSLLAIGSRAFADCYNLTLLQLPASVQEIGSYAFWNCSSLRAVEIPASVTAVGPAAFGGCDSLESFTGKFASADQRSLVVNGMLLSIAPAGLTTYSMPSYVQEIGTQVFTGQFGFNSVSIPDSVSTIQLGAFYYCFNLESVVIGSSVTEIGNQAFQGCTLLSDVTSRSTTPPTVYEKTFADVNIADCILRVPADAVSAYSSTAIWQDFGTIVPCDSVAAQKGTLDNPYTPSEAIELASALDAEARTEPVFVKGIVSRIKEISPNFGNATFYISDDGTTANEFYIYRCKGLGNNNITSSDEVKLGDQVVIYGPLTNYKGNTPETVAYEAYIYSINDPSAVEDITADSFNKSGKTYNLQGVEVGPNYRGIVIQNGKKMLRK